MKRLGASESLAVETVRLANVYNLDLSKFAALIYSESSYNLRIKHALPYVVGLGGINLKAHPQYKKIAFTPKGNLEAAAMELRGHLDRYHGDYYKALTAYKGISQLGRRQAKCVLEIANKIK